MVCHHPVTKLGDRDETRELLDTLQNQLSPKVMDETLERGKTVKLEEAVAEFIGQGSSPSSVDRLSHPVANGLSSFHG